MATEAEVMKEFLVDLGFRIDERGFKGFIDALGQSEKLIGGMAIGAFTAASAVTAFMVKMADGQEKLHYTNELAETSATNFNAFTFAASKAGVTVEAAGNAISGFAMKLRTDPGESSILTMLGINPNQDPTKVLEDYIKKPMSDVMRSAMDEQLGLSDDIMFLLAKNPEQLSASIAEYNKRLKDSGVDLDKVQASSADINNSWRDIKSNIGTAADVIYSDLLPAFAAITNFVDKVSLGVLKLVETASNGDVTKALIDGGFGQGSGIGPVVNPFGKSPANGGGSEDSGDVTDADMDMLIGKGEHGKPGQVSPKGAMGTMQLMPDTAKQMAGELNVPYDADKARTDDGYNRKLGKQYLQDMLDQYGGDRTLAFAAYNAGPTKVDKWLKDYGDPRQGGISNDQWAAKVPFDETRNYLARTTNPSIQALGNNAIANNVAGGGASSIGPSGNGGGGGATEINQTNHFQVTTNGSPSDIKAALADSINQANRDLIRYQGNPPG